MEYHIECRDKDYDLILKEYKEIPLTQGKVALVDIEDYDYLNQFKWYAQKCKNNLFYVVRNIKKDGKQIKLCMHREIMKTPKGMHTDHINGNGLDNRRNNLRICNSSKNQRNSGKHKNNTSGYKGVFWHNRGKKWQASIGLNSKLKHLGLYSTKEEAAIAYNEAAKKYFGGFARLNTFKF